MKRNSRHSWLASISMHLHEEFNRRQETERKLHRQPYEPNGEDIILAFQMAQIAVLAKLKAIPECPKGEW